MSGAAPTANPPAAAGLRLPSRREAPSRRPCPPSGAEYREAGAAAAGGRIGAVLLLAVFTAGCWRPLASKDEFFRPSNDPVAAAHVDARLVLGRHRALQTVRRACAVPASAPPAAGRGSGSGPGPDAGAPAAREALDRLCAERARPPVAAYGSASAAYRRWVTDDVRELPAPAETASSASGGG